MDKLLPGLALAAISGLTFLAYRHPAAFATLYLYLIGVIIIIDAGFGIWDAAIRIEHVKLIPFIKAGESQNADTAISSLVPKWWVHAIFLFLVIYITFLFLLPKLLAEK